MSDQELDLYTGGELAPISPAPAPDLFERTAEDSWQDHLPVPQEDRYPTQGPAATGGFKLFGESMPAGVNEQQVNTCLNHMAGMFYSDMLRLGHSANVIHAATQWFQTNARKAPVSEPKRHNYDLHDQATDSVANSFANAMARVGASQTFLSAAIWWLEELYRRLDNKPLSQAVAGQGSPLPQDPLDALSEDQFQVVLQRNELAKAQTLDYLRGKWGSSFHANLRTVDEYFSQLPIAEQEHLNQYTDAFIAGTNYPETILFLFNQAIGAGTLPQTGAEISAEIQAWENVMKNEPKRWRDDDRAQARYRHLLDLRGY